jgi:hypothetical protein
MFAVLLPRTFFLGGLKKSEKWVMRLARERDLEESSESFGYCNENCCTKQRK